MTEDLPSLKRVRSADVYKAGRLAGHLNRTGAGTVTFSYTSGYLDDPSGPVATTLPLTPDAVEAPSGALPAFFSGLLPEGHRLTVLRDAVKTSLGDELSLLLAVGADVPGDVQVVPAGRVPEEPGPLADTSRPGELDFAALADAVDPHGLPGVQAKASASMLTTPVALAGRRYILKLDPPRHPHLVVNEAAHLTAAHILKIPVAKHNIVSDRHGRQGRGEWTATRVREANLEVSVAAPDGAPDAAKASPTRGISVPLGMAAGLAPEATLPPTTWSTAEASPSTTSPSPTPSGSSGTATPPPSTSSTLKPPAVPSFGPPLKPLVPTLK